MVVTCCVIGCSARADRDKGLRFFSIPAVITHQGKRTEELTRKRQTAWIGRINRKDWMPTRNSFVCSRHFITRKLIKAKTMSIWFDLALYNSRPSSLSL